MSLDPSEKCVCPHCNNNIEFDVTGAGMEIACPHCGDPLVLPEIENTADVHLSAQITENVYVCPNCRRSVTFDRDASGTEFSHFACDYAIRLPAFSDDPTVVVGQYEEQFLNLECDWSADPDFIGEGSGYHEVKSNPVVEYGVWGCLGCILLVVTSVVVSLLPDVVMDKGTSTVISKGLIITAIGIFAANIVGQAIHHRYYSYRLKQFGNLKFVSPRKNQKLEMGDDVQGSISLNLKKPLPHGSLALSLSLLHGTRVGRKRVWGSTRRFASYIYRSLGRSALLVAQDVDFQSGEEVVLEFTIPTPKHERVEHGFEESDNYLEAKQLPWSILHAERKKHLLKWQLTAQLVGPLGIALERQIDLKVA